MLNPIAIHTVSPEVPAGSMLIAYNWRSTAQKVVPESQKHRSIVIGESLILSDEVKAVAAKFRPLIVDAITEVARERLADFCQSANMMAAAVSADLFSVDSLLSWNSERAALQQRLTADEVKAWASTSATVAAATSARGPEVGKAVADQLIKLAGPNHGMTPEKATKFLSVLWQAADADNITGLRVMLRLQAIAESSKNSAGLLDSILG